MASSTSRGAGAVLLVLILLLGIAGGSAWVIHKVLTGQDPIPPMFQPSADSGATGPSGPHPAGVPSGDPLPDAPSVPVMPDRFPPLAENDPPVEYDGVDLPETAAPNVLIVPEGDAPATVPANEDSVVRPAFVNDIAAFLTHNYWPRGTHPSATRSGITTASLRWANLRYGAEFRGRVDPAEARSAILGYVLNPDVIGRVYSLYADSFVDALSRQAERKTVGEGGAKRPLTAAEKKEMFSLYASFASRVASALERYAADPGMAGRVRVFAEAEKAVDEANRAYMESMMDFEEAEASGARDAINAARLRMDMDAAAYQKRVREREDHKDALVKAMSVGKASTSGSDTLVYVAFWAYRRGPENEAALRACAKALADIGAKLAAAR